MKPHVVRLVGFIVGFLIVLFIWGVPQDGYRAYTGTHEGDRWRLFHYYQTARHEGVPAALERYGVEPK